MLSKYEIARVIHAVVYFLGRKADAQNILLNDQNQYFSVTGVFRSSEYFL